MGLSTVTPRSFNSTGAQSVCRANQPQSDTPIESQFLTQCNLEYIHGSGESVVRGSLGSLPLESLPSDPKNQDVFYLESDVDAISGMDLTVSLTFPTPQSNQDPADGTYPNTIAQKRLPSVVNSVSKDFLLAIINRIEVRVGGLTVQRITPEEIWQRNLTEQDYSSVEQFLNSTIDCRSKLSLGGDQFLSSAGPVPLLPGVPNPTMEQFDQQRYITRGRVLNKNQKQFPVSMVREGDRVSWTLSLPVIGRTNDMHNCFLQAGAVSNSITIVVIYNQVIPDENHQQPQVGNASTKAEYGTRGVSALLRLGKRGGFTVSDTAETNMTRLAGSYQSYLTVRNHTFTNTEADFVQQNIVNRVVTASQCVVREITQNETINHSLIQTPLTGVSELTGTFVGKISGAGVVTANNGQVQSSWGGGYVNESMCFYGPFKTAQSTAPINMHAEPTARKPETIKCLQYTSSSLIPITISLDDVDINTSHLLISAFASTHKSSGEVSVSPLETINCGSQKVDAAGDIVAGFDGSGNPYGAGNFDRVGGFSHPNNYLQSLCQSIYSYSGFSIADTSQNVAPTGMILRGALTDYVEFIEVVIGSDRTGRMPARKLLASNGTFGLTKSDAPIYVVPLADMPFSTAGVPMSRVGTKQVILYIDSRYAIDYGPFTQVEGDINNPQFLYWNQTQLENGTVPATPVVNEKPTAGIKKDDLIVPWAPITKVAVTAVGTQVQTTVGGSTSFAS